MRIVFRCGIQRCIDPEAKRGSGTHDEYGDLTVQMINAERRELDQTAHLT